jgi:hypothetical protein
MTDFVKNTKTGRYLKKGTRTYKKLLKQGLIEEDKINPPKLPQELPDEEEDNEFTLELKQEINRYIDEDELEDLKTNQPNNIRHMKSTPDVKNKLAEHMTDIVKDNQKKFIGLSQDQTDELLKDLLYTKIYGGKKEKSKKKINKSRWKVYVPDSESESESD